MPVISLVSRCAAGLEALVQTSNWTRGDLLDYQARRLYALVRHASKNVPYYRRLFRESGLRADDIRAPDDLQRLPITSRSDLQSLSPADVVAEGLDPGNLVIHYTSGTSGEPLAIRRTFFEEYLLRAFRLREQFARGVHPTDRRAAINLGNVRAHPPGFGKKNRADLRPWLAVRKQVYSLQPEEQILAELRHLKPDVLEGFGTTLAEVAPHLTEADGETIRPRLVFTCGETAPLEMRQQVSAAFGAPVFDFYASHEFNLIAAECPLRGLYHAAEWSLILEVVRDGRRVGPGEQGEVVATGLHSYAMPFIRYRPNDLVILGQTGCACGAPVMTLRDIVGRTIEKFTFPGGKKIHPYVLLGPLMASAPWLRHYQIVQDRSDHILIKVVPTNHPGVEALGAVAQSVAAAAGHAARVDVEVVERIPAGPNGKHRPYYSLVS